MSPSLMARKQILQSGIKLIDMQLILDNNLRVPKLPGDEYRPFWSVFTNEFNTLEIDTRKFILENLDVFSKQKMDKIKNHLRSIYRKKFDLNGPISKDKRIQLLTKNLYSKAVVEKRKREHEENKLRRAQVVKVRELRAQERLLCTPTQKRKAHSTLPQTPQVIRQVSLCDAPVREPKAKRRFIDMDDPECLATLFDDFDFSIEQPRREIVASYENDYIQIPRIVQKPLLISLNRELATIAPKACKGGDIHKIDCQHNQAYAQAHSKESDCSPGTNKSLPKPMGNSLPNRLHKPVPHGGQENRNSEIPIFLKQIASLNRLRPPESFSK
jgi:hypothetical protein